MTLFPRQTDLPTDIDLPPLPTPDPPLPPFEPPAEPSETPPSSTSTPPPPSSDPPPPPPPSSSSEPPSSSSYSPSSQSPSSSSSSAPPPPSTSAPPSFSSRPPRPSPSSEPDPSSPDPTPSESASELPAFESSSSSELLTTVTTTSNGIPTTFTTQVTALANARNSNGNGDVHRTALIAGLTTGLVVLLAVILGGVFAYRRQARRRALHALAEQKREKESKNLLDSEGFDDDVGSYHQQTMRSHDFSLAADGSQRRIPSPVMIRSRASETGSIFRENVWPPPQTEMMDPIHRNSSQVDLGTIVDDVMGPYTRMDGHKRLTTESTVDSTSGLIVHGRSSSSASSEYYQYSDPFQARPMVPPQNVVDPFATGQPPPPSAFHVKADSSASSSGVFSRRSESPTSSRTNNQPMMSSPLAMSKDHHTK